MNRIRQNGFTLVELTLAMAFIAALLLVIAMTIMQIGNIYNRGITYKDVNQTGSALANELQRSINTSVPFGLIPTDNNYVDQGELVGGRLCTGQYSYIWNYGRASIPLANQYGSSPAGSDPIRFVKVSDKIRDYCKLPNKNIIYADAVELVGKGQNNLAIHSFTIDSPQSTYDLKTGQRLYSISFSIGTNESTSLDGLFDGTTCKPDSVADSNPSYCAVNRFDIVARAGNDDAKK